MVVVPGDLVQLGNLPEWVTAAIAARAIYGPIGKGRERRAVQWAETLLELTGYSPDELAEALERSEETAELVASAWTAGSRAVDDDKRRLLARAAAAGIVGDENVLIDDRPLFVHTLDEIDVLHMKLLVLVGEGVRKVQGLDVTGGWSHEAIIGAWPAIAGSLEPLVAVLNGAGLIYDTSASGFDGFSQPQWNVTSYGQRFAGFVRTGAPSIRPDTDSWPIVTSG